MQLLFALAGVAALFFGAVPPAAGYVFHLGHLTLLLMGTASLAFAALYRRLPARLRRVLGGAGVGLYCFFALATGAMALSVPPAPTDDGGYTMVVLGAATTRAGAPGDALRRRLDCAAALGGTGPILVTGGGGEAAVMVEYLAGGGGEAAVMVEYLAAAGIEPARLYADPDAANTRANLQNAQAIIAREGLPTRMLLVSESYHLPRAALLARQLGVPCAAAGCGTPWLAAPACWAREWVGMALALLRLR